MAHDQDDTQIPEGMTPGTTVGHYRIVQHLGAGGMGDVYLAQDTKLDRKVALKFLPERLRANDNLRARFLREARAAARLDHPNIVTVYEVGEDAERPYIAMQYVAGDTLQRHAAASQLPVASCVKLVVDIARGLHEAHEAGIVHRDIKPGNILIDGGRPIILDFGLATVRGTDSLTETGATFGTAPYMSPEQAQGQGTDHRSDLFSLGIVLYELICGKTPFLRDNIPATLHAILHDDMQRPAHAAEEVPESLVVVLRKCLSKNREDRYANAADLAQALEDIDGDTAPGGTLAANKQKLLPSIAVLPFANMSADPENEFFSDGLTEELLNVLAKNPGWKVSGRTSSFAFKGKQEDLRDIGRKLGVETLLEGSVRKAGDRVRITAQLVNAGDGFHLWSETYDRVLDDIFALQDDIAGAVAEAMNVTLLGTPSKKHVPVGESFALALRAKQAAFQMSDASVRVAAELYQKALTIDPKYAGAWAGLSRVHVRFAALGYGDSHTYTVKARETAEKALALDPDLAEAHETRGYLALAFEFDVPKATEHLVRAYELAPGDCHVVTTLSLLHGLLGDLEEMLRLSIIAIELDPLNPEAHLHHGRGLHWADRPAEAEGHMRRAMELSPDMTKIHALLSWVLMDLGRWDEALEMARVEPMNGYRHWALSTLYKKKGDQEKSDAELAALESLGDDWAYQIACTYALRDEYDEALNWLRRSIDHNDSGSMLMNVHNCWRPMHNDHRYQAMLKELHPET